MPRPAPRVAPATSATRPLNGRAAECVFFPGFFMLVVSLAMKLNACLDIVKRDESTTKKGGGRRCVRGIGAGHAPSRPSGADAAGDRRRGGRHRRGAGAAGRV